ncbi:hypothetical protein CS063_15565 [Sporanaerobium hydrogeniformans]|uniref:Uncharacterized protein n=1 Tax=Sporanaerobium hydrogeniformans TaxID=3072179 RepID=A0AC61D7J4_9FIRM|nr:hypothetical protein [Sporanaerobium hydrogeniformans]PHV69480.1 hypothetical protein CS063_15565 [Sporanaerobium hydrogeniformans]
MTSKKNPRKSTLTLQKEDPLKSKNGNSPIHDDGLFIADEDPSDGFANMNTIRYGEEVDVDDL